MKIKKAIKAQGGFTLIEMLIVVAIIAILVAVSIPMVTNNLDKARQSTDDANERAAKTAALLEYTEKGTGTGSKFTQVSGTTDKWDAYYDASNGQLVKTAEKSSINVYGKYKPATGTDHTDKVVKITLTVPTSGAVTCETTWD